MGPGEKGKGPPWRWGSVGRGRVPCGEASVLPHTGDPGVGLG